MDTSPTSSLDIADATSQSADAGASYRDLIDPTIPGIAETDMSGSFIGANDRYCEMVGYTREELLAGMTMQQITHPDDLEGVVAKFRKHAETGEPFELEKRYVRKDGQHVRVHKYLTAVLDEDTRRPRLTIAVVADVSARSKTEQRLQDTADFNQDVLDSIAANIAVVDGEGVIRAVNRAWRQFAMDNGAASPDSVGVGASYIAACDPSGEQSEDEQGLVAQGLRDVLAGKIPVFRIEYPCHSPTAQRWFFVTISPLSRPGAGAVVVHQNITERRVAENALLSSQKALNTALKAGRMGSWELDMKSGELTTSPTCRANYGRESDESLTYQELTATVHPDDVERWRTLVEAAVNECGEFEIEYRVVWPDETLHWVHVHGTCQPDAEGKTRSLAGVSVEVTQRKLADEELRKALTRFEIVGDGAEVGFWFCDLPFDELVWDDRVKEHFWLEPDAGVHIDTFYERIHPDDRERTRKAIETSIAEKTRYDIEYRTVSPDGGRYKWIRAIGRTFYSDAGDPIRFDGITLDITDKKSSEQALHRAKDELEQRVSDRTKELGDMNRQLSVEVEERKAVAATREDLLRRLVTSQEDERQRLARDLHDQLGQQLTALRLKLVALRNDPTISDVGRVHVAGLQSVAEQIDASMTFIAGSLRPSAIDDLGLKEALRVHVEECAARFEMPMHFHSNLDGVRPLAPEAEIHLYRIVQEAINNAIKHAKASEISVMLERSDSEVVLVIEDDGIGFDPESKKVPENGHGFGLVGMSERANLINARLEIESRPSNGTAIYLRVPAR